MALRKKTAASRRAKRRPANPSPPLPPLDLAALLKVGADPVIVPDDENDNVDFMAELIDTD